MPTRSIALLIGIGLIDLVTTAWLHAQGLVVELNPIMRAFIDRGDWLFILVKGASLVIAWIVMARYARTNRAFVRKICLLGSVAYVLVWVVWFTASM